MTLRCIIVDDEPYAIQLLTRHLEQIAAFNLLATFNNPLEALAFAQTAAVDLVFLDINMPRLNGLQLASVFPPGPQFIFTTAYAEFAVESYEKNALDYLLKPITFERFLKAATKAITHFDGKSNDHQELLPEQPSASFFIKSGKSLVQLALDEVALIESQKDYVLFHTTKGCYTTLKTLKELENILPGDFHRVHHSFMINLRHVRRIEDNHVHVLDQRIPISEKYHDAFMALLRQRIL